jgi:ABC-type antimicrobial peptide transport system permease subunit
MAFYPWKQVMPARRSNLLVRTEGDAAAVSAAVRQVSIAVHRDLFESVQTLTAQIDESLVRERMLAQLSGFFGGLALLLTCIGICGIMAVTRRTQEIGVRIALGARLGDVVSMVLRESLRVAIMLAICAAAGLFPGPPCRQGGPLNALRVE